MSTQGWNDQRFLVGQIGTFYIYSDKFTKQITDPETGEVTQIVVPGIKLGDGNAYLIDLPFLNEQYTISITEEEKRRWNNKLSFGQNSSTYTVQQENLVFTVI